MRQPWIAVGRFWALLGIAGLFWGCISTKAPVTTYYLLNPTASSRSLVDADLGKPPLTIEVSSLRLPQYLERPHIVTRSSENRLELAELQQWGGNLRKNMVRVFSKNLSGLLNTADVAIAPHRPVKSPDYRIELTVTRFERDAGGRVRLTVQWRLIRAREGGSLATRFSELESPVIAPGPDLEPTVAAMSDLLGALSRVIAKTIAVDMRGRSGS